MYFEQMKQEMLARCTADVHQLPHYTGDRDARYIDKNGVKYFRMEQQYATVMYWITTPEGRLVCNSLGRVFSERQFADGERTVLHRHDYIELGFVVEGTARQVFSEQQYDFQAGSLWLSDRSCFHQDVMLHNHLYTVFFNLRDDFFDSRFMKMVENQDLRIFLQNARMLQKKMKQFISFIPRVPCPEVSEVLQQMAKEIDCKQPGWQYMFSGLLIRLFSLLMANYQVELTNQTPLSFGRAVYSEVIGYIDEHYADVTLQLLSDRFHYSADFISRMIRDNTGLSYSDYIQKVRIDKACTMLAESREPIDQIIEQVGYRNKSFFYSIFLKQTGKTPSQYRRENAGTLEKKD